MKKSLIKAGISLVIALSIVISLIGCGSNTSTSKEPSSSTPAADTKAADTKTEAKKELVKIKYPTYRVGSHPSAPSEKKILDGFKAKYGNDVEVVIEELPSDTAYTDKMKILCASGDLPDVVEGKNGVLDLAVKAGLAKDLTEYLNADPDFKADLGDQAIQFSSRNGKPYGANGGSLLIGYFYNKEMFNKAGIKPAETWDEFMSNCEKLKAKGITPLSMQTGENSWTTNLLLASMIGTSGDTGNKFINGVHPASYNTPEMIDGLKKIQTLFQKYTTKDAIGGAYANAANNFEQGKTAMIANGPWMISDFSDAKKSIAGMDKNVGVALYPGAGVFTGNSEGYLICSKDKEHADAAFKFIKYRCGAEGQQILFEMDGISPRSPKVKISDEFRQKNPLTAELIDISNKAKYHYDIFDTISYASVIDQFGKSYAELAFGKTTPEEMVKKLDEAAAKNK